MGYYDTVAFYPESSLGYLTHRIHTCSTAAMEGVFAEEGITKTMWSALVSIGLARATTCVDLARDLAHDKGAMTRLLDQLEGRGLIRRERSEDDRRYVHLALTDEGFAIAERCRAGVAACWNRWLEDLPRDEIDRTLATLRHVALTVATVPADAGE